MAKQKPQSVADHIIGKFGGTRKMAAAVRRPPSTIQSWKAAGHIPAKHQQEVLDAAVQAGIALRPDDFFERRGST